MAEQLIEEETMNDERMDHKLAGQDVGEVLMDVGGVEMQTEKKETRLKELKPRKESETIKQQLEKTQKDLEETRKRSDEHFNQLKYLYADFDNYRKKFEKEKENIISLANENLIKEFIIILDDFEQALKFVEDEKNKDGLVLLQKKFSQILELHGLKCIESLGKKFDPNFHEVLFKELSEREDNEIIEEIQKGYLLYNKVLRPAKVKIAEKIKDRSE